MRAVVFQGPYQVSVETVPDPSIEDPGDVIVQVEAAAVCGSDLWTYRGQAAVAPGARIGHEFLGRVVETGSQVTGPDVGDWVVAPFRYSDGECSYCREGLSSSCLDGGFWSREVVDAGQGELVRVPHASATLVKLSSDGSAPSAERIPDLLALADVMPTGLHGVRNADVQAGDTVIIVGDGAVGQCAIIAARMIGADRVIVLGGAHSDREEMARANGADEFVSLRGDDAVAAVRELTSGELAKRVVECVGSSGSFDTALSLVRAGGGLGYVGLPHGIKVDLAAVFGRNISISGGICPARDYLPELLRLVSSDELYPGIVFSYFGTLDNAPEAYRQMDQRETVKALLWPSNPVTSR